LKVSTCLADTWFPDTVVGARNQRRNRSGPRVMARPEHRSGVGDAPAGREAAYGPVSAPRRRRGVAAMPGTCAREAHVDGAA
jgi:hypothetical protein